MIGKGTAKMVALLLALSAGVVVVATTGFMTADVIAARRRVPSEKAHVDSLIEKVRLSPEPAEQLHAACDRLTDESLLRESRQGNLAWALAIAAGVFVAASKCHVALRDGGVPLPRSLCAGRGRLSPVETSACSYEQQLMAAGGAEGEDIDLSTVDAVIEREGGGSASAIPILHAIQMQYRYLPETALQRVCERTEIPAAQLAGVASFYSQFRRSPVGEHLVKVCHGTACHVAGAPRITDELRRGLGIAPEDDTDPTRTFTVEQVACLGCCTLAPVVQIDDVTHGHLRSDTVWDALSAARNPKTNGRRQSAASGPRAPGSALARMDEQAEVGEIRIGLGSCCVANGSGDVHDALEAALASIGATAIVKRVGCIGMCHQTPLVEINLPGRMTARYARTTPEHARTIIGRHFKPAGLARRVTTTIGNTVGHLFDGAARQLVENHVIELRDPPVAAFLGRQKHIATEHYGCIDPTDLDEYLRHDGFKALDRCRDMAPDDVIQRICDSGLRGRGGAGFPTAEKWTRVRRAEGERKTIICNGDEGDPGAFMDRMLMESYPYRIIEGVAIAAYAVGATEGYLYIRREYPLAAERIREALQECEDRDLLGMGAADRGNCLKLKVIEGAGAFVCGEETALIASIEGQRGMPRLRPPYPAQKGLWGRPTLVNNVETYAVIPWILRNGPEAFAELGTASSKGTKVFALAGKVRRGGLIEVPMGVTIREIVEDIGGGIKEEKDEGGRMKDEGGSIKESLVARRRTPRFKAVQIGGPSGGCVPAELADTVVDYEALADVGAMMGSGGLVVLDETDCMVDIARFFLTFTQGQSCGGCTTCRIGTRRLLDILERLCAGEGRRDDLAKLDELARSVKKGSLCGLGKTAPNPVLTTLRYFREEYEAHLEGRCPAGQCKALIRYEVTDTCSGCTLCAQHCPADAIAMTPYEKHEIDDEKCTRCDTCRVKCPEGAIVVV